MDECIFCKIVKKEIPARIVYEDDENIAFLDRAPTSKGHTLVIPKQHNGERFSEYPDEEVKSLFLAVKNVSKAIEKGLSKNYNIGINNGPIAGQIIFHPHVHIIPRYENDGLKLWPGKQLEDKEMDELQEKIKSGF